MPFILTSLKIGLLQLNSTVGDFAANRRETPRRLRQPPVARGAEFILAPEFFLCGYPPRDLCCAPILWKPNCRLAETAKRSARFPCASALWTESRPPRTRAPKFRRRPAKWQYHLAHAPNACCRPTTFLMKTVILNRRKTSRPSSLTGRAGWASRFARTFGTTRISGRNGCIAAIRSRNSSRKAPRKSSNLRVTVA